MGRKRKDGYHFNCYMDSELYNQFVAICEVEGVNKTSLLETAIRNYIKAHYSSVITYPKGIDAIYRQGDTEYARCIAKLCNTAVDVQFKSCLVLGEYVTFDNKYYKILLDEQFLIVPANQVDIGKDNNYEQSAIQSAYT